MRTLRSYRLVPALLALSLVLTAAAPLARHACGMTEAEMATMPCCDGKSDHHDAMATHGGATNHGTMDHGATPDAAPPCHDAPEAPAPCPHEGATLHDACCFTADAPTAPTPERLQLSPAWLVALATAFVLPPEPPPSPPRWSGDLATPAPVALHVLYERFLI